MFSATGPLTPKCVHSIGPRGDVPRTVPSHAQSLMVSRMRDARQAGVPLAVEHQRRQRRRRVARVRARNAAPARSRSRRCPSSAANGRRWRAPRRARRIRLRRGSHPKRSSSRSTPTHALSTRDHDAPARRFGEQRIEHRSRSVRVGKQLAVVLLVQRHAELCEERRGALGAGNARSTRRTTRGGPPQKSRSVTTRFVTLQRDPPLTRILAPMWRAPSRQMTRSVRRGARGKDGRGQPGSAGADRSTTSAFQRSPSLIDTARLHEAHKMHFICVADARPRE